MKRLSEYIGESYFDYLARPDDLVLLMDESHRYRVSAGLRAINELNPVLGLELTATPQVERGQSSTPFQNVIYSYPLANALAALSKNRRLPPVKILIQPTTTTPRWNGSNLKMASAYTKTAKSS
ncbi:MAG: DEAD/DEAH box helicase family protein [Caldilineaceae bacterium]